MIPATISVWYSSLSSKPHRLGATFFESGGRPVRRTRADHFALDVSAFCVLLVGTAPGLDELFRVVSKRHTTHLEAQLSRGAVFIAIEIRGTMPRGYTSHRRAGGLADEPDLDDRRTGPGFRLARLEFSRLRSDECGQLFVPVGARVECRVQLPQMVADRSEKCPSVFLSGHFDRARRCAGPFG